MLVNEMKMAIERATKLGCRSMIACFEVGSTSNYCGRAIGHKIILCGEELGLLVQGSAHNRRHTDITWHGWPGDPITTAGGFSLAIVISIHTHAEHATGIHSISKARSFPFPYPL